MNPELRAALELCAAVGAAGLILYLLPAEDPTSSFSSKRRARLLFWSKLDWKQRLSWLLLRRFVVVARSGRRYTICSYQPFNVRSAEAEFCLQVGARIPAYDKLLAQKLLLEADEERFVALSNVRPRTSQLPLRGGA
jgi:hypothetical protein